MAIYKTEAIVLRSMEYSETSLIVWLLTRDHGRVDVIAKGARRPRSPFEGALEPLVRGELLFYRKARSEGLEVAKEFDPLDLHTGLRRDLPRLYRGLYLGELATELSGQESPSPEAYDALRGGLAALAGDDSAWLDAALLSAELQLVAAAGLAPELDACTACGAPVVPPTSTPGPQPGPGPRSAPEGPVAFSPAGVGVLCLEHGRRDGAAVRVSVAALRTLRALAAGQRLRVPRELGLELREVLDRFVRHHLGKDLRLLRYLRTPAAAPEGPFARGRQDDGAPPAPTRAGRSEPGSGRRPPAPRAPAPLTGPQRAGPPRATPPRATPIRKEA